MVADPDCSLIRHHGRVWSGLFALLLEGNRGHCSLAPVTVAQHCYMQSELRWTARQRSLNDCKVSPMQVATSDIARNEVARGRTSVHASKFKLRKHKNHHHPAMASLLQGAAKLMSTLGLLYKCSTSVGFSAEFLAERKQWLETNTRGKLHVLAETFFLDILTHISSDATIFTLQSQSSLT